MKVKLMKAVKVGLCGNQLLFSSPLRFDTLKFRDSKVLSDANKTEGAGCDLLWITWHVLQHGTASFFFPH